MIPPDDDLAPGSTKSFEERSYAAHSKDRSAAIALPLVRVSRDSRGGQLTASGVSYPACFMLLNSGTCHMCRIGSATSPKWPFHLLRNSPSASTEISLPLGPKYTPNTC